MSAGIAQAQLTGPPPPPKELALDAPGEVVSVQFVGNKHITTPELQSIVATHVTSGFEKLIHTVTLGAFGSGPSELDRATLDRDTAEIIRYHRDNGYLSAKAEYVVNTGIEELREIQRINRVNQNLPRGKRIEAPKLRDSVVFVIVEGPVSNINGVAFEGLETLPNEFQPQLTDSSTIKVGSRYTRKQVAQEVERLEAYMTENGYPYFHHDTTVVQNTTVHRDVNIISYFHPGHRYKFGQLQIVYDTGSVERSHVAERVIRHQILFDSGQWYRASDVRKTEQLLYRLGAFDLVRITLDTSAQAGVPEANRDGLALPVTVLLRMKLARELDPGVYFGTGKAFGFGGGVTAIYTDRNAFRESGNLKFQTQYLLFSKAQQNINASVDLFLPDVGLRRIPLSTGFMFSNQSENDVNVDTLLYAERIWRARFGTEYMFGDVEDKTTLSPDFIGEFVRRLAPGDVEHPLQKQINTIFAATFQRDQSNDPLNPTGGWNLGTTAELGLPILVKLAPSDFNSASYWKAVGQIKKYLDFTNDGTSVVATRLKVGYARKFDPGDPLKDLPLDRRLVVGGAVSNRGWQSQELLVTSNQSDPPNEVRGYTSLETNVEWRVAPFTYELAVTSMQKMLAPLRIAVFMEAGQAWDYGVPLKLSQLGIANGVGIHYNTPFGTLRVDFGIKTFDPNPDFGSDAPLVNAGARPDEKGKWIFARNWKKEDVYSFHFAIGQAF